MRVVPPLASLLVIAGCGRPPNRPAASSDANHELTEEEPEDCKINGFDIAAAALGGASAGANGGRNAALESIQQRCERAREVQRWNRQQQRENALLRAEIERDRKLAELEDQRFAASRAATDSATRCGAGDPAGCRSACNRGVAVACTLHGYQLWRGDGVSQSRDEGLGFFVMGCEGGDSNGCEAVERVKADLRRGLAPAPSAVPAANQRVFLFGGKDHKTFLGCFCGGNAENSLENEFGKFGKHGINVEATLWSIVGPFRSSFDDLSACNRFASNPPVIVREDGTFLGRLTRNTTLRGAVTNSAIVRWLEDDVCEGR